MTIAWTTDPGGLFVVSGHYAAAILNTNGVRGSTDPDPDSLWGASGPNIKCLETEMDDIITGHTDAQQALVDGLRTVQSSYVSAHASFIQQLQSYCQAFVISVVNTDNPQIDRNIGTALTEMIRQMRGATQTVQANAVAGSVSVGGSNVGTPKLIVSVIEKTGKKLEYSYAESLVAKVFTDHNGGATLGSEAITVTGTAAVQDKFSQTWPGGSSCSTQLNIIDPTIDAGTNYLTNSDFEDFTSNTPDNWNVLVSAAGADILKDTSHTYGSSAAALQILGDGSTLSAIAQTFNSAGGTTATLAPATVYAVNFWCKVSATPSAGVLALDLVNSSNAVINDDNSVANTITLSLPGISTTYVNIAGFFRTPTNLPSVVKLRLRLSTALDNAKSVYVDFGAFGLPKQLYNAGPYVAAFRSAVDVVVGDTWTISVTNDRAGKFQNFFERAFNLSGQGLILPSAPSAPSIDDALIV